MVSVDHVNKSISEKQLFLHDLLRASHQERKRCIRCTMTNLFNLDPNGSDEIRENDNARKRKRMNGDQRQTNIEVDQMMHNNERWRNA